VKRRALSFAKIVSESRGIRTRGAPALIGRRETGEAGGRVLGSRAVGILGLSAAPRTVEDGARWEGKQTAARRASAAVRASRVVVDYAAWRAER
jgi:hypothetical protein